jgi:heme/copper-type cytochrome/quinol oxidase subunit 1
MKKRVIGMFFAALLAIAAGVLGFYRNAYAVPPCWSEANMESPCHGFTVATGCPSGCTYHYYGMWRYNCGASTWGGWCCEWKEKYSVCETGNCTACNPEWKASIELAPVAGADCVDLGGDPTQRRCIKQ